MPANNRKAPSKPEKVKDAYWTIYRLGTEVEVFDEIHNRPLRRLGRICPTVEQAEDYISQVLAKYRGEIAIFDRI